jgi:hypothetical protein
MAETTEKLQADQQAAKLEADLRAAKLEADQRALSEFRDILTKLVEGAREEKESVEGAEKNPGSLSIATGSVRNPIDWLNRYLNRIPEFEKLVAKYTNILPTLDTDDGRPYRQMALIGIKALQRRKLEIAETVYSEVLFKTTASANLGSTLGGILLGIVFLGILGGILFAIYKGWWYGIKQERESITNRDVINLFVAFCSGCFGSVVSFLGRLSEFDSKQVRSQRFLVTYGFTLPIIGGGFALVFAAALDAKIITIFANSLQLFIVIGFLAGFSERFTKSILDAISKIVSPGAK